MSKIMLFYPWLKGNGAHWAFNFMMNPKLPRAQVEAFRKYNEEAGDPRANDALNRRNPSQLYLGQDATGADVVHNVPFPWRIAEQGGNVLFNKDLNSRIGAAWSIVESRLRASYAVPVQQIGTFVDQKSNPRGTFTGAIESAYDKDRPGTEQLREAAISAIERSGLYPSPMLVKDITDNGYDQKRVGDYISELGGSGIVTRGQSADAKRLMKRFAAQKLVLLGKLYKRQSSSNPYTQEEFDFRRKTILDRYDAKVKRKTDELQAKLVKKTAPPTNLKWDKPEMPPTNLKWGPPQ
jgi:hypothetical protein